MMVEVGIDQGTSMKRSRMMMVVEMQPNMMPKTSSSTIGQDRGSLHLRSDSFR